MNFVFKRRNFVSQTRNLCIKTRNFSFKMMNFAGFVEIAEAYEVLSDADTRGKFDRGEEIKPEGQQQQNHNPFAQHMHFRM